MGKMRRGEMCVFITECSPLRRAAEQGSEDRKTRRASLSPRPVTAHSHPPARVGHDCCNRPHFLPQCPSISPVSSQSGRPRLVLVAEERDHTGCAGASFVFLPPPDA